MKTAAGCTDGGAALYALLASQTFLMADLFTFTLADGTILRYTNADGDLTIPYVGGNVFSAVGPFLTRGSTRIVIGVEVDSLEVNFLLNSTVMIGTKPIAEFAAAGGFDGARVSLWRTFMPPTAWGDTSAGYLIQFVGRTAEVMCTRSEVKMVVNSDLELLNIMLPRNVYQAGCNRTLFDTGCGLNRATYASSKLVQAGSTKMLLNATLAQANGYFDLGSVIFVDGPNAGMTRMVKSYTVGALRLSSPLTYTPGLGDTFTVYPGCDKTQATCTSKYSNSANFRGFPYIPVAETSF